MIRLGALGWTESFDLRAPYFVYAERVSMRVFGVFENVGNVGSGDEIHSSLNALAPGLRLSGSDDAGSGASGDEGFGPGGGTVVISKPKTQTKTPSMYRVILMNDDYTPMDFVIHVLQKFFSKDMSEATKIMLQVHQKGAGVCGVFSYDIAETKVYQVNQFARASRHPLKCTMEKV